MAFWTFLWTKVTTLMRKEPYIQSFLMESPLFSHGLRIQSNNRKMYRTASLWSAFGCIPMKLLDART